MEFWISRVLSTPGMIASILAIYQFVTEHRKKSK